MPEEPNKSNIGERMKESRRTRKPEPVRYEDAQTQRGAVRRSGKKNRGLFAILYIILFSAAFTAAYFLTRVDTISVKGNSRFSQSEVINLSGLYTGRNIMLYDLEEAKRGIEKNPYIVCRSIERLLPTELLITVSERSEFAAISTSPNTYCVIDSEGVILDVNRTGDYDGLIPIYGLGSMGYSVGTRIDSDRGKLRPYTVMEILRALGDRADTVSSIDISNTSSVKLVTENGVTVMLGDSIDMTSKIERMFSAMEKLDQSRLSGAVLYINSTGTTDVSYSTPAPTNEPEKTAEPLPTNVPQETPEPDETPEPTETAGGDQ